MTEPELLRRLAELEARLEAVERKAFIRDHERASRVCWCGIQHFPHMTWTLPVAETYMTGSYETYPATWE